MKFFKISSCIICFLAAGLATGFAQTEDSGTLPPPPADPLLELLYQVQNLREIESDANQSRLEDFRRREAEQRALLEQARIDLQAAKDLSVELNQRNIDNEKRLSELETQLDEELGDLGEIFGNVRQISGETKAIVTTSLVNTQLVGRETFLGDLGESKALPKIEDLEKLWSEIVRETVEAGRVVYFDAPVLDAQGIESIRRVTRVGIFNSVSDGKFLRWNADIQRLSELPRQPAPRYLDRAIELEATTTGFANMTVDPSAGVLMRAFAQSPDLRERIEQGKLVGYVILALLVLGLLISLERLVYLYVVGSKMGRQLKDPGTLRNNPLGRVMAVFHNYNTAGTDLETLELKLDEAIMKEIPSFERGLPTIKILAAVAPLLGLLGTVVGMIQTFQSITLFGTGDPKLMAGGISQALVTTVLGLVAAIPLVLIHSILQGKSDSQVQLLEEQSAGLVADFSEKRHSTPTVASPD